MNPPPESHTPSHSATRSRGPRAVAGWIFCAILPWLILLAVPAWREVLRIDYLCATAALGIEPFPNDRATLRELANRHPDDVRLQAVGIKNLDTGSDYQATRRSRLRAFKQLTARFPKEAWLLGFVVWRASNDLGKHRLAGALDATSATAPNPPEESPGPPPFTQEEVEQGIALARRGRALEPDNCFYDLILARFLFAAHRDAECFAVLHEGSLKPRYDDHLFDQLQNDIDARKRLGLMTLEEKWVLMMLEPISDTGLLRSFARLVAWQSWKMERAGNHAGALQLSSDFARLCDRMLTARRDDIFGLTVISMQQTVWTTNSPRKTVSRTSPPANETSTATRQRVAKRRREIAGKFAVYAAAHGRHDLSRETLALGERQAAHALGADRKFAYVGTPNGLTANIQMAALLGGTGLPSAALLALVALPLRMILLFASKTPLFIKDEAWSIALSLLLIAGCGAGLWAQRSEHLLWPLIGIMVNSSLPVACGLWSLALLPLLANAALCAATAMWRRRQAPLTDDTERFDNLLIPDRRRFARLLCTITLLLAGPLLCIATVIVAATQEAQSNSEPVFADNSVELLLSRLAFVTLALCYGGWIVSWRWFSPPARRPYHHHALRRHLRAVGYHVVLYGLLCLALAIPGAGWRADGERYFAQYLQQGEIVPRIQAGQAIAAVKQP